MGERDVLQMTNYGLDLSVVLFILVVLARLLVPLTIPRYPLPGILAAMLLDLRDQVAFLASGVGGLDDYQAYDKALDIYYLAIAYISTIRNWVGREAFIVGRALWYYRLVGVALFEYFGARWLLLLFANVFEYYFALIEGIKVARNPFVLPVRQLLLIAGFIWVAIKVPQEWVLHIAQAQLVDVVKTEIFGVPPESPWVIAVAHRPLSVLVLALVVVLVVVAVRRFLGWLPPRSWAPTLSADTQIRKLGWEIPQVQPIRSRLLGWTFVEKAILVSLVALSFSQILPGNRNAMEVIVGTTTVIAAVTVISQLMIHLGVRWGSVIVQFLVVGATISGIGVAVNHFLAGSESHTPPEAFFSLTFLMALIVVLFDRYKWIEKEWERERLP